MLKPRRRMTRLRARQTEPCVTFSTRPKAPKPRSSSLMNRESKRFASGPLKRGLSLVRAHRRSAQRVLIHCPSPPHAWQQNSHAGAGPIVVTVPGGDHLTFPELLLGVPGLLQVEGCVGLSNRGPAFGAAVSHCRRKANTSLPLGSRPAALCGRRTAIPNDAGYDGRRCRGDLREKKKQIDQRLFVKSPWPRNRCRSA